MRIPAFCFTDWQPWFAWRPVYVIQLVGHGTFCQYLLKEYE